MSHNMPPSGDKPESPLIWGILTTVLCCLPLGVVSIVFAAQVDTKWKSGDRDGARECAEKAKGWAIASAVCGIIAIVIVLAVTSSSSSGSATR